MTDGADGAPVVLVHGFAASFDINWRRTGFVDRLAAAGRTVIPFDFPGHGSATRSRNPRDYDDLAHDLAGVVPDGPVDAIGYSMGAAVLLRLAGQQPHRFRRLVVAGIGDRILQPRRFVTRAATALETGTFDEEDAELRLFIRFAEFAGNDRLALAACVRREEPELTVDELSNIVRPVLLVVGEDDTAGRPDAVAAALPDVTWETLAATDHFSIVGSERFMDAAMAFIGVSETESATTVPYAPITKGN